MAKNRRVALLPTNIILLQNVVRRDPESYKEEFLQQYAHYESLRDIFLMNPSADKGTEFGDLVGFVSAVCSCYPKETAHFPEELRKLLLENHRELHHDLREKIIQCLTMLRNKDIVSAEFLIQTIFPLLHAYSTSVPGHHVKQLRHQIYSTLIALLKSVNTGSKNQKLNRSTQALLFNLLEKRDAQGLWATKLTRELWRRGIWDDSRTVELMTQATLHPEPKVSVAGARFFLGADKEREENFDESSDDEGFDMSSLKHKMLHNKKTSKRGKKLELAIKSMKKKNSAKHSATYLNFSAIHLLRDPQGFAEEIFTTQLSGKSRLSLEHKILFMNLVSRLVGTHKLTVLGLYTFFLKYLTPKQRDVTQVLAACAQASHDLVPPELIQVVVRKIADEFVSDGVAAEVASAGINTIREILSRAPLAVDAPLLQDLTEYKGSKSKAVMMAARSLISLYREVAPEMLNRKDRGKVASMEMKSSDNKLQYGVESSVVSGIPGIELLIEWKKKQGLDLEVENDADWEVDSDNDDDVEGEWVTVESDKDYDVSDSEDEDNEKEEVPELTEEKSENEQDSEEKDQNENEKDSDNSDSDLDLGSDSDSDAESEEPPAKKQKTMDASTLLASRVLTPADFAKLEELKAEAGLNKIMGTNANENSVDSTLLVGKVKYKQLREEKIAQAKEGKEDRLFGSKKGKRDKAHSTTNKEKARQKNFVMMIHKKSVQGKQKLSLRDRQKVLRAHIDKQKKKR